MKVVVGAVLILLGAGDWLVATWWWQVNGMPKGAGWLHFLLGLALLVAGADLVED